MPGGTRIARIAVSLAVAAASIAVAAAVPAQAVTRLPAREASSTSGVKIVRIYFDSPGSDTGSNASLNAEWVKVKNAGARPRRRG